VRDGFLVAALCLLFFFQCWFASRLKSPTSDEPTHILAGASYVAKGSIVANPQHPPLMKELAGISLALAGVRWHSPLSNQELANLAPGWEFVEGSRFLSESGVVRATRIARFPALLLSPFLGLLIYLWGRELGGSTAGIGALVLFALDPNFVAHAYLVTTDVGVTLFGLLFLFALYRYLNGPNTLRLAMAGLALGLTLCSKFNATFWLPIAAVLILVHGMGGSEGSIVTRLRRPVLAFVGMLVVAIFVIQVLYLSPRGPILYLYGLSRVNADHIAGVPTYLAGHLQHRFLSYFVMAWLVKEPIATILLALAGVLLIFRNPVISRTLKFFVFLPPIVFLLACTLLADDIGIRYAMPAMPFAYLAGGVALASLFRGPVWTRAMGGVACLWLAIAAAGIYPDHLAYFNELACLPGETDHIGWDGGSRCGPSWLADSNVDWGQGLPQLKAWLDAIAAGRPVRLAYFGGYPPEGYGIAYESAQKYLLPSPPRGLYAISSHIVAVGPEQGDFGWLREEPLAVVGHAYYIFEF
jgi:hypothetical protein